MKRLTSLVALAALIATMLLNIAFAWNQPLLVSDRVGTPLSCLSYRLLADSTQNTYDLASLNGVAYLAFAEWDELNYRHFTKLAAYNQNGEIWLYSLDPQMPYHSSAPSQVLIWRDHVYVVGQIVYDGVPSTVAPFIAKFDTSGEQEWFTLLVNPVPANVGWLQWGPQLTTNPVNGIGISHFTIAGAAKFQLINLENGQIIGPPDGSYLHLYGSIGYSSFSYFPAWLNGAWWFIHKNVNNTALTIASVNLTGIVNSTPIYWGQYSTCRTFAVGDSLAAVLPNYEVTQYTLTKTSVDGNQGTIINLATIPSNVWSIYDLRQASDGTIATVIIRQYSTYDFTADVTAVRTDDSVTHTILPFDMLPASCQAELIGDHALGLTRSVSQNLLFTAIDLTNGSVIQEDTVGPTSPVFSSMNWSDLCGDNVGGAYIAWYVEEGVSFPGHLYINWIPGQTSSAVLNQTTSTITVNPKISPNPFNPTTTISYALPKAGNVTLTVFDINGRQVAELVNGWREIGAHQVNFDGSGLSSGIYIYRLEANNHIASGKMMLVK